MSTGLSGEQLDALRAEIYTEATAAGDEGARLIDQTSPSSPLSSQIDKVYAKSEGLYRALFLLDNARREAARTNMGSRR